MEFEEFILEKNLIEINSSDITDLIQSVDKAIFTFQEKNGFKEVVNLLYEIQEIASLTQSASMNSYELKDKISLLFIEVLKNAKKKSDLFAHDVLYDCKQIIYKILG